MPVKHRAAKERRPTFSAEALALFCELENAPRRGRDSEDKALELARLLGLTAEWWTGNSVLDRGGPSHPLGSEYISAQDWERCRAVRLALLDALGAKSGRCSRQQESSSLG